MTHTRQQTFDLRCLKCNVVVRFGDGSACAHVSHGIAVEWHSEETPAQADLFSPVEAQEVAT